MRRLLPLVCALWSCGSAGASGMSPTCAFSTGAGGTIFGGAKYDVAKAYRASDLVVIGAALASAANDGAPLEFRVSKRVKGPSGPELIRLTGRRCFGTACAGLSLPAGLPVLALLRAGPDGVYGKVDGTGNDGCPNVFEVKESKVLVGGRPVALKAFLRRLKGKSAPIDYP